MVARPTLAPRDPLFWQDAAGLQGGYVDRCQRRGYIVGMTDAVLPILITPHGALRTKARRVTPADAADVARLVPRLFTTMYRAPGIGLAAPQVGVGLRLAVVDLQAEDPALPGALTLINPEIIAASEEWVTREEGCLSVPGQYADVARPAQVRIRYQDQDGRPQQIEAEGLLAACLQHEIDHLDGVLFVDHISALKRNMLLRRLAKEMKQKAAE